MFNTIQTPIMTVQSNEKIVNEKDINSSTLIKYKRRIGVIILAGGLAQRAQINDSKALYKWSSWNDKHLLEIFIERILHRSNQLGCCIDVCIVTNDQNNKPINDYINTIIATSSVNVSAIIQHNLPFLNEDGSQYKKSMGVNLHVPNGNGLIFHLLKDSGKLNDWQSQGIDDIYVLPIDNVLNDPIDLRMLSLKQTTKSTIVKTIVDQHNKEAFGRIFFHKNKWVIQEHIENNIKGKSLYINSGQWLLSMDNVLSIVNKPVTSIPLQKVPRTCLSSNQLIYKQEYFITSWLSYLSDTILMTEDILPTFCPLKRNEGMYSEKWVVETINNRLLNLNLKINHDYVIKPSLFDLFLKERDQVIK